MASPNFVSLHEDSLEPQKFGPMPQAIPLQEVDSAGFQPSPPPKALMAQERLPANTSRSHALFPRLPGSRGYGSQTQRPSLRAAGSSVELGSSRSRTPRLNQVKVFHHVNHSYSLSTDVSAVQDGYADIHSFPRTPRRPATSGLTQSGQAWESKTLESLDQKIADHSYWEGQWETPLYALPGPDATESLSFWSDMVYPTLPTQAKYETKMLREIIRDRMAGRLGVSKSDVAEEADRLFKDCFHELYRRVPVFMLAMKKSSRYHMQAKTELEQLRAEAGEVAIANQVMAGELAREKQERAGEVARLRRLLAEAEAAQAEPQEQPEWQTPVPPRDMRETMSKERIAVPNAPTTGGPTKRSLRRLSSVQARVGNEVARGEEKLQDTRGIARSVRQTPGFKPPVKGGGSSLGPEASTTSFMSGSHANPTPYGDATDRRVRADVAYFDAILNDTEDMEMELLRLKCEHATALEKYQHAANSELPDEELDVMAAHVDSLAEEMAMQTSVVDGASPEELEIKSLGVRKIKMDERVMKLLRAIDVLRSDGRQPEPVVTGSLNAIQDTLEDMDVHDFLVSLMHAQRARVGESNQYKKGAFYFTEEEANTVALMQARWAKMEADLEVLEAQVFEEDGKSVQRARLAADKAAGDFGLLAKRLVGADARDEQRDAAAAAAKMYMFDMRKHTLEASRAAAAMAAALEDVEAKDRHEALGVRSGAYADVGTAMADHARIADLLADAQKALAASRDAAKESTPAEGGGGGGGEQEQEGDAEGEEGGGGEGAEAEAEEEVEDEPVITLEPLVRERPAGEDPLEDEVEGMEVAVQSTLCRAMLALMAGNQAQVRGDAGKDLDHLLASLHDVTGRYLTTRHPGMPLPRGSMGAPMARGGGGGMTVPDGGASAASGIPLEFSEDGGETFQVVPNAGPGVPAQVPVWATHVRVHPPAEAQFQRALAGRQRRSSGAGLRAGGAGDVEGGAGGLREYSAAVHEANNKWKAVSQDVREHSKSGDVFALIKDVQQAAAAHGVLQLAKSEFTCSRHSQEGGLVIEVQRLGGSQGAVRVAINAVDGSAAGGLDFEPFNRVLAWEEGDNTARQVEVTLLADEMEDGDNVFAVELSGVQGGAILGGAFHAVVVIKDDRGGEKGGAAPDPNGGKDGAGGPGQLLEKLLAGGDSSDGEDVGLLAEGEWMASADGELVYAPAPVVAEAKARFGDATVEGVRHMKRMRTSSRVELPAVWRDFIGASYAELKREHGIKVMPLRKLRSRIVALLQGKIAHDRAHDRMSIMRGDMVSYTVSFHLALYEVPRLAKERLKEMVISVAYYFRKNQDAMVREYAYFCGLYSNRPARPLALYLESLLNLSSTNLETQKSESIFWSVLSSGRPMKVSLDEAISCCIQVFKACGQEVTSEVISKLKAASATAASSSSSIMLSELLEFIVDANDALTSSALPYVARVIRQVLSHKEALREDDDGEGGGKPEPYMLEHDDFVRVIAVLAPPDAHAQRLGGRAHRRVVDHMFLAAAAASAPPGAKPPPAAATDIAGTGGAGSRASMDGVSVGADACIRALVDSLDVTHLLNLESATHRLPMARLHRLFVQTQDYNEKVGPLAGTGGGGEGGGEGKDKDGGGNAGSGGGLWKWITKSVGGLGPGISRALLPSDPAAWGLSRDSLLILAATFGDKERVRVLLADGADPNGADVDRRSAMHLAASEGNVEVMELLLAAGADVNARDRWGNTPLQEAVRCRQALAEHAIRANGGVGLGQPLLLWSEAGVVHTPVEEASSARLCAAVKAGELEALRGLLDGGQSPDSSGYDGRTPLHVAAAEGMVEAVDVLVEEYNGFVSPVDRWGSTPLTEARRWGHMEVVEYLLEHGAS